MKKQGNLTKFLSIAYKKLKAYVFFDRTLLPLRDKIVQFEMENGDMCAFFSKLTAEIQQSAHESTTDYGVLTQSSLDSIDCYVLPKSVKVKSENERVFTNICDMTCVDNIQYYIDMNVVGHILGILWIMLVGYKIDKNIFENSYGNRIKKTFKADTYSPYMFEPYFSQYESWRDKGLNQAKKLLSNSKNAMLLTLDLRRFYYSVGLEFDILQKIIDDTSVDVKEDFANGISEGIIHYLSRFVFDVCRRYSEKVRGYDKDLIKDRIILPIGFAPAAILSNLCLQKFDDVIINGWNPTYYGRYVDDILIVDKVEQNSPLIKLIKENKNAVSDAIEYLLCNCDAWRRSDSAKGRGLFIRDLQEGVREPKGDSDGQKRDMDERQEDEDVEFFINPDFLVFPKSKIKLQSKKVKLFYFDSTKSDALIKCFQKNIQNNISEFRYLPEDEPVFSANDYTEIYSLIEKGGPHKLNGISELELDKFRLSKFLGKYMRISGLIDDTKESLFCTDIEKIFTPDSLLENYTVWEKILTVFVSNEQFDKCKKFIDLIADTVKKLNNTEGNDKRLRQSLFYFLQAAVNRAFALIWGNNYNKVITDIDNKLKSFANETSIEAHDFPVSKMREGYFSSRMADKYAMPFIFDYFVDCRTFCEQIKNQNESVNLTSMASMLKFLSGYATGEKQDKNGDGYVYYPYMVTIMDLSFVRMIHNLLNHSVDINTNIYKLKEEYAQINYKCDQKGELQSAIADHAIYCEKAEEGRFFIKAGKGVRDKIKVAIGNAQLRDDSLEIILRNEEDRSYARYEDVVTIVNTALREKADILVLPEAYLPISWLPIFARSCAKNQMAAVVGLEHFRVQDTIYNITAVILPYTVEDYRYAYIYFHLKTHYAPKEKELIVSRGMKVAEGCTHPMFDWNNFWFSVYCCYEVTSIKDRALYQSYADATVVVEWNMDVNYYNNIVESLVRDLHCYCIQVNISRYGDSRITQPSKTENKDILRIKGGTNATVLVDEIDIKKLRNFQILGNIEQRKRIDFKVTSPDFEINIVEQKNKGTLWDHIKSSSN